MAVAVMSLMVCYFVLLYSHEMSWMRSGTELNQFMRIFLPTLSRLKDIPAYYFSVLVMKYIFFNRLKVWHL